MINCDGLVKIYETDDKKVMALEGLDLTVATGEDWKLPQRECSLLTEKTFPHIQKLKW